MAISIAIKKLYCVRNNKNLKAKILNISTHKKTFLMTVIFNSKIDRKTAFNKQR